MLSHTATNAARRARSHSVCSLQNPQSHHNTGAVMQTRGVSSHSKNPFDTPNSPLGADLKGLYEYAAREHVQGRNASGGFFSWAEDKRPAAVWVIDERASAAQRDGSSASTWVFKRVSGSSVPCAFDTESRVDHGEGQ